MLLSQLQLTIDKFSGSGKTFTIEGNESEPEMQGIIHRAAAEFFACINESDSDKEKIVVCF